MVAISQPPSRQTLQSLRGGEVSPTIGADLPIPYAMAGGLGSIEISDSFKVVAQTMEAAAKEIKNAVGEVSVHYERIALLMEQGRGMGAAGGAAAGGLVMDRQGLVSAFQEAMLTTVA